MARQRQPLQRKTRTREHILADLAVNHVERQVLLATFTLDTIVHDYGLDAIVFPFNSQGEPEPGLVFLQISREPKK